jgi:putative lipoic acid-binding regulatory protein
VPDETPPVDGPPPAELLESVHEFPGTYVIKAIGPAGVDFVARVVAAAESEATVPSDVSHHARESGGGRHVAVTLEVQVQSAQQVQALYAAIRRVEGLTMLL